MPLSTCSPTQLIAAINTSREISPAMARDKTVIHLLGTASRRSTRRSCPKRHRPNQHRALHHDEIHPGPTPRVVVDEDGVGGGVVDTFAGIKGFVNGSSPLPNPKNGYEKQNFRNLKAQCYYMLADHINDRRIGFTPRFEDLRKKLIEELEQVKSRTTRHGRQARAREQG